MAALRKMACLSGLAPLLGRICWTPSSVAGRLRQNRRIRFGGRQYRSIHALKHAPPGLKGLLRVSEEVEDALATNRPVVALESTIYTHGDLSKDLGLEEVCRRSGAVPAVIGVLDGVPRVGLSPEEIVRMTSEGARKVSRRDMAYVIGMGVAGRKIHGGTTIAGTMLLARLAGIRVFGTGGLGGVHRGWETSMDISADLTELGRTRVAVVSSGCKGFLDIPATLEYLETQGVMAATFADGRKGPGVKFPAFWARESETKSPFVVETEKEAAAIIHAQEQLRIETGFLFANPIAEEHAVPGEEIKNAIQTAVDEGKGISGSDNTPYILKRIRELTQGRSSKANEMLVRGNVARAAAIAVELSALSGASGSSSFMPAGNANDPAPSTAVDKSFPTAGNKPDAKADILVAGSVALDLSCDYAGAARPGGADPVIPRLHTSNPGSISQSVGGVGHNVALAAHRVSSRNKVKLYSMVGSDIAGSTVLSTVEASGLDTSLIRRVENDFGTRTAQYVAVNDAERNLMVAIADMDIFTKHPFSAASWDLAVEATKPKWLVVDGNWGEKDMSAWIQAAAKQKIYVAFEPVSTAKSTRLFPPATDQSPLGLFPSSSLHLATPNQLELATMHDAAHANGYFESMDWFEIIDSFGMRGARDKFVRMTSTDITDAGIPVQSIQLLPYIPTVVTKLGAQGALLTMILEKEDPRLLDPAAAPYVLTRCMSGHPHVGGVYMRLFPATEKVDDVLSVNGVGDTFLGVLTAGMSQGGKVDQLIEVAQKGAVMTLRSHEAVSADLGRLEGDLMAAARS